MTPRWSISGRETIYSEVIAPRRNKLVWYNFRKALPSIAPLEREDHLLRGAEFRYRAQPIESNPREAVRGTQRVQHAAPAVPQQPLVPSPTILAFRVPLIAPSVPSVDAQQPNREPSTLPSGDPPVHSSTTASNRAFTPPAPHPEADRSGMPPILEAPELASLPSSDVAIAIVSLNPAAKLNAPLPEASVQAQFSAATTTDVRPSLDAVPAPSLVVPGLLVHSQSSQPPSLTSVAIFRRQAPTSRESLEASARLVPEPSGESTEIRMTPPPDPSFEGRDVFSIAVQMPNIVSSSGSWLMWFAEREPLGPRVELQPPVPLHKVDPKYIPSAVSDGVEGSVVLTGVLQTNGKVREIKVLKGVDARLDLSAVRALFKWEFGAAQRNGVPVEMDMVAVIPFLLRNRASR